LTPARMGVARLGATRMGYPILPGVRVPTYALFGVARLGATRLNYHSPFVFVAINGVHVATGRAVDTAKVLNETLTLDYNLNESPDTGTCTTTGFVPLEGQDVVITLGSKNNLIRHFGGRILSTRAYFVGTPANYRHDVALIDYTWDLNRVKVRKRYTSTTVAVIAADLIATYAPGFTVSVAADIGAVPIDEITFTEQDLASCLTNLTKRVEGDWVADYHKVVKLFFEDTSETNPVILNAVHRTLDKPSFAATRDLSQILTRVYVEGGGVNAGASVGVGETILPLDGSIDWYELLGGVVVSGPQRIVYTGKYAGGGGGLVGTGAAPSGAPIAAPAAGTGLSDGTRDYAVTFVTGAGETIAGPRATITSGLTAAPAGAPIAAAPTIGTGPDPGTHSYAVTFVTASGETTASPLVTQPTSETPDPVAYPVPGTPTVGTGPDDGTHEYAATFVTGIGETAPGLIGPPVLTGPLPAPSSAPTVGAGTAGTGPEAGSHDYAVTFVNAAGETTAGPSVTKVTDVTPAPASALTPGTPTVGSGVDPGDHDYVVTFVTAAGETTASPISAPVTITGILDPILIGAPSTDAAGPLTGTYRYKYLFFRTADSLHTAPTPASSSVVASANALKLPLAGCETPPAGYERWWYRTLAGGSTYYRFTPAMSGNWNESGGFLHDGVPDTMLMDTLLGGADPAPATSTVWFGHVPLTAIPTGDATVTNRRLYRRRVGTGEPFYLLTLIANNSATTYTDTTPYASLSGTTAPVVNTAALKVNHLTAIPIGPTSTTSRKLYRTTVGGSQLKLLATLANNTTTTYTDATIDASLGANVPTTNTAALNVVPLTGIPVGDSNVTARNLYRRSGGAGLKFVATIANNFTTTFSDTVPNASLGAAAPTVSTAYLQRIALSAIPIGSALVTSRNLYRTAAGGSQLKLLTTLPNNTTTTFLDTITDASLGANVPVTNTATANQVALSSIPIGASAVTQRKIYRTVAGGAQLKLLTTIADNVTSTYVDSAADGSLGANVPTVDTSGLAQPQGNVIAGSTSLQIASIGAFPPSGWAVIGNGQQVIRYTGISGTVLIGIPASGPGAIQATIAFNSTVTAPPQLTGIPASGVGSILYPILQGDEVNLFVQVDDLEAQAGLSALRDPLNLLGGAAGIQEDSLQDRRLSHREALARGAAYLARRRSVAVSLRYQVRDVNVRAGRTQAVNIGPPWNLFGVSFMIQQVNVSHFLPARPPIYDVSASSVRVTFDDVLRALQKAV
jgi:hypothetical protein